MLVRRLTVLQDGDSIGTSIPMPGRVTSLLVKPVSALCNLDCSYCFYLDRATDPYDGLRTRRMTDATLERLVSGFMAYSHPHSAFLFQGGEPTLAGLDFYRRLVELQATHARPGHVIANSIQTNGLVLDDAWCALFRTYGFEVGVSLDGPEELHDRHRVDRAKRGSWRRTVDAIRLLQRAGVEPAVLCVVSQANVQHAAMLYDWFTGLGLTNLQFIPLAEFAPDGTPAPGAVQADEYGHFLCGLFDRWWPDRARVRIRFFDNIAEALAGMTPGTCTMHQSCDSYAVVEFNGDVYPCDFFVDRRWCIGNIADQDWEALARDPRRATFASKKQVPHAACAACTFRPVCHQGCPKHRHGARGRFDDLDWLCGAYKQIFARAIPSIAGELAKMRGR